MSSIVCVPSKKILRDLEEQFGSAHDISQSRISFWLQNLDINPTIDIDSSDSSMDSSIDYSRGQITKWKNARNYVINSEYELEKAKDIFIKVSGFAGKNYRDIRFESIAIKNAEHKLKIAETKFMNRCAKCFGHLKVVVANIIDSHRFSWNIPKEHKGSDPVIIMHPNPHEWFYCQITDQSYPQGPRSQIKVFLTINQIHELFERFEDHFLERGWTYKHLESILKSIIKKMSSDSDMSVSGLNL